MLTYLTTGESHGPRLTAVIDGLPAGLTVDVDQINNHLFRRQQGYGRGGRQHIEQDRVEFVSGLRHSVTLGGPVTMVIENRDWANWSNIMDPVKPVAEDLTPKQDQLLRETSSPRPGHADLAGGIKWGHHDLRNVLERASARETAARVALGSLARQILEKFEVQFAGHVVRIGDVVVPENLDYPDLTRLLEITEASEVRCYDAETGRQMKAAIRAAIEAKDSLGGVAELIVQGLPVGLGSSHQGARRLDARLAGALMSIQSIKGVEFGLGFAASARRGSVVHDQVFFDQSGLHRKKGFYRKTNNAGGLEGGITNGEDLIARVAAKPISTLMQPLKTVDVNSKEPVEAMVERTDICVVPAVAVIIEAVSALVLTEAFLEKFGGDNMTELERHYQSWLDSKY